MAPNTVTALARPSISSHKPLAQITSVAEAIEHPELKERLHMALPRHMNAERMLRVFHLALQRTPDLAKADMRELIGALIGFAAIGIEPNTPLQHGWLIPFAKRQQINGNWETVGMQIQPIIGYRGFIDLSRRSGSLISIHADVVYEGDPFSYEYGTNEHLSHKYGDRDGDLVPLNAYACASVEGGHQFEVMPWKDVLRTRDASEGYKAAKRVGGRMLETTPWVAYLDPMARKTPVRRLFKMLPVSIEQSVAVQIDEQAERKHLRFGQLLDVSPREVQGGDDVSGLIEAGDYDAEMPPPEGQGQAVQQPANQGEAQPAQAEVEQKKKPAPRKKAAPKAPAADRFPLTWPDGSQQEFENAAAAAEAIGAALYDAQGLADVDALSEVAQHVRPSLTKEQQADLKATFDDVRKALAPAEESNSEAEDPEPDQQQDEAPAEAADEAGEAEEAEAVDWTVDVNACMDGDKVNTMKLAKAVDDLSKECSSPEDWHEFVDQNAHALELLQGNLASAYKKVMDRYAKATS